MKDKLTIEHLACYFPYGLKIQIINYKCDYVGIEFSKANGFYFIDKSLHLTYDDGSTGKSVNEFKPLLRPLSDITKPITHNGETFVPVDILFPKEHYDTDFDRRVAIESLDLESAIHFSCTYFSVVQKLISWHFDIHGLIPRGLAVDINSLKEGEK